ncbi:MAG: zinc-binding dehydrogenase [Nitrososphaerota archaeon]|nr:zinc-binding dehydrogenase [Nitrososphaerota archaeon]
MKAFVVEKFGERLRLMDRPKPIVSRGEALVRVKACGIGLTLSWIRLGRMSGSAPRIIGHEIAGIVEEVGEGVTNVSKGDSVAVYFYLTCGKCEYCMTDRETLCTNFKGNVGTRTDGGLAEYVKLPSDNLFKFSSNKLSHSDASIISDAIATPLHVAKRRAGIRALDRVMVIGAGGGVGIHMVQMAKLFGADVFAVDISEEKLKLASTYGATHTILANDPKFVEKVKGLTDGKGVHTVIDFVSRPSTISNGFSCLSPNGKIVLLGHFHPEDPLHIDDPQDVIRKEISIMGSRYATKQEFREAIEIVENGLVKPVVTARYKFEDTDTALRDVEDGKIFGRAVVEIP